MGVPISAPDLRGASRNGAISSDLLALTPNTAE